MSDTTCYLCGEEPEKSGHDDGRDVYWILCRRCGSYRITHECLDKTQSSDERTLAAISAGTRQASESGSPLLLRTDNWDQVAAAHKNTPVRQKLIKVLRYAARNSKFPGDRVRIEDRFDYPVFDAASADECTFLVGHVIESRHMDTSPRNAPTPNPHWFTLTVQGWDAVEPLIATAGTPGRCFVAMSFLAELDEAYLLGIKAAVEHDCGMVAVRMKELQHNEDICDRLLSEIRQAQFLIADFTGHKNGVYYEAGFARALGREVINCCRDTDFDGLHFDTNHLSHIRWKTPTDLRLQLTDRIRATIAAPVRTAGGQVA